MKLRLPTDLDLTGKRVIYRVAYDVPLKLDERGELMVADDSRLTATMPTLQYLLRHRCKIIIMSWLGRPVGKPEPDLSLKPVAERLAHIIKKPVKMLNDCVGEEVQHAIEAMKDGEVVMLENVRFHPEENANSPAFVEQLAALGDLVIFDAFAQAHRTNASTVGLLSKLPSAAGFLMNHELDVLTKLIANPQRPLAVVLGGD